MTVFDALLMQKSKAFFTGGFLAPVHTTSVLEAIGFLIASLVVDAGTIGVLAMALFAVTARARLTPAARNVAVLFGSLAPFAVMDFVDYRLLAYLGDAFDLGLMFELTGRQPLEIAAVALPQLLQAGALISAAAGGLALLVWAVNRLGPGIPVRSSGSLHAQIIPAVALAIVAIAATCSLSVASETFREGLRRKPSGRVIGSAVATVTDFDRDGFGLLGGMRDVALFSPNIYPWALDIPGNDIDENGVGGDLPEADAYRAEPARSRIPWAHKPNVVLVVLESFRADAVGRRVAGRSVTPELDRLAVTGVSSSRTYSHNGYTAQSRFHLMSGRLLATGDVTTLIDDFAANGYETAYFSAQDESFGGRSLSVGFDRADVAYDARQDRNRRYSTFSTPGSLAVSYVTLQERVARFLENRDRSRPLFLYVNFHDTHYPYYHEQIVPLISDAVLAPAQIAPSNERALEQMYLNTVANVDRAVGWVVEKAEKALGAPPAVIVTADHGESLFDEGFLGHGYALNDVQTRIPLIVRGIPLVIDEPFAQVELRDAICQALSAESPARPPRLTQSPGKGIFQYLGSVHRPRQIGWVSGSRRTIYDFRTRQVLSTHTEPRNRESRDTYDRRAFLEAVRFWERLMLASAMR